MAISYRCIVAVTPKQDLIGPVENKIKIPYTYMASFNVFVLFYNLFILPFFTLLYMQRTQSLPDENYYIRIYESLTVGYR